MAIQEMTDADRLLLDDLAECGIEGSTPRKLRRLRSEHLIPPPMRGPTGRGKGRPSLAYPRGTAERVALVQQLRDAGYSFRQVRIELLWRGTWVAPIKVVRADLVAMFDDLLARLPDGDDPGDAADQFVRERYLPYAAHTQLGRTQANRIKARRGHRRPVLEAAALGLVGITFGLTDADDVNLQAFAEVYGLPPDRVGVAVEVMAGTDTPTVRARAARFTEADIERYRPLARDYLDVIDRVKNDPQVVTAYPGIVDAPDSRDPDVRVFALVSTAVVSECIAEWTETITSVANKFRNRPEFSILLP